MTTNQFSRYRITKPQKVVPTACDRCGGQGGFEGWPGFTCYRCFGNGIDPTHRDYGFPADWTDEQCEAWVADRAAKAAVRRERREAKIAAKAEQVFAANVAACPVLADGPNEGDPGILWSIYHQAHRSELTEKQIEAYARIVEETADARKAEKAEAERVHAVAPDGRVTVTGEIVSVKVYDNQWGGSLKMVVRDDRGFGVFVAVPSALLEGGDPIIGRRARFDATLERSEDDDEFAFGKRPTKASFVDE